MKKKIKYIVSSSSLPFFLIVISIILYFSGCDWFKGKNVSDNQVYTDTIVVDENLEPLMKILVDDYEHTKPERKLFVKYEPARNCVADLVNKSAVFCLISREFSKDENDYIKQNNLDFTKFDVCSDAVAFIVNPENPVYRVTSDDLKKIFSGQYNLWTDLNVILEAGGDSLEQNKNVKAQMKGNENKIKVYIQRQNSGTFDFVKDSVLAGLEFSKSALICSTSVQILDMIRNNKNAIGISNLSWLSKGNQDSLDATVRPLRISKIYPNGRRDDFRQFHQGIVYQKKYPYIRVIHLYATHLVSQLNSNFINYLLKTRGQSIILENGLVPLNQPIRTIQLN